MVARRTKIPSGELTTRPAGDGELSKSQLHSTANRRRRATLAARERSPLMVSIRDRIEAARSGGAS